MTATIHTVRPVTTTDRFAITLFFAVVLHAVIILGISFDFTKRDALKGDGKPPLDVTIVHTLSNDKPQDTDYLAQANQVGGGNTQERTRPTSPPEAAPNPLPSPGNAAATQRPVEARAEAKPAAKDALTVAAAPTKLLTGEDRPKPQDPVPVAATLVQMAMEMAKLEAELDEQTSVYSKKMREKLLVPSTMSHVEAAYLDAWQKRVELIGNMNYPEKAREQNLSGALVLMVAVNADGSIADLKLLRSSGHKVLDDAAMRIVKLAAPFPPLPEAILKEADVLKIPRVWKFDNGHTLRTQAQ